MLQFLLFGAFLWQQIVCNAAAPTAPALSDPAISSVNMADPDGIYNLHVAKQMFYLNSPLTWNNQPGLVSNANTVGKELGADYVVTKGMGAHKLHVRKLQWNQARKICQQEGGHLAIIRTASEEKIILQLMAQDSVDEAWVGYHDQFEEGDWISVLDEPLAQTGWARWSKKFSRTPDNLNGNQNCARIVRNGGGIDDNNCEYTKPFVCKITNV